MSWKNVKRFHFEISSLCNAVCPGCARWPTQSYFAHPIITKDALWTIDEVEQRFPLADLANIIEIWFNGTVGDFITNPDSVKIAKYFKDAGVKKIIVNTNGSGRPAEYWEELGAIDVEVNFALDGLADTHSIYRRETDFDTIIKNATTYIKAGGTAHWVMTVFEHNKHQVEQCRKMAESLGFKSFTSRPNNRGMLYVFGRNNEYIETLYPPAESGTEQRELKNRKAHNGKIIYNLEKQKRLASGDYQETEQADIEISGIKCHSLDGASVYISAFWEVSTCCFIGHEIFSQQAESRGTFKEHPDFRNKISLNLNGLTVRESWEAMQSWDWVYNKFTNPSTLQSTLKVCKRNCSTKSSFNVGKEETIKSTTTSEL